MNLLNDPIETVLLVAVLIASVVAGTQTVRLHHEKAAHAEDVRQWDKERGDAAQQYSKALETYRIEEQRRIDAQTKVIQDAQIKTQQAAADAARADSERDRLRQQVSAYAKASRAAKDTSTANGSTDAADPIGVLADLFGLADERAGKLASYADQLRTAGEACQASYNSLNDSSKR